MILADNGSPLYVSGVPDPRWNDDQLSRARSAHRRRFPGREYQWTQESVAHLSVGSPSALAQLSGITSQVTGPGVARHQTVFAGASCRLPLAVDAVQPLARRLRGQIRSRMTTFQLGAKEGEDPGQVEPPQQGDDGGELPVGLLRVVQIARIITAESNCRTQKPTPATSAPTHARRRDVPRSQYAEAITTRPHR